MVSGFHKPTRCPGHIRAWVAAGGRDSLEQFLQTYTRGADVRDLGVMSASKSVPYSGNIRVFIETAHAKDISPLLVGQQEVVATPGSWFRVDATVWNPRTGTWDSFITDRNP